MAERLSWIRVPVQRWANWEPERGGAQARTAMATHYPQATCVEVSAQPAPQGTAPVVRSWRQRLGLARAPETLRDTVPPEGTMQLVWANMLAHQAADPRALLADWLRALSVGGFLMFSCLGPDSLRELRRLYANHGWAPPAHEFTDMHDWGDRLLTAGFADPVMDMEHITLTFGTGVRLLEELRGLGRNLHPARSAGLRTPGWRDRLAEAMDQELRPSAGAPISITFEVIYGHAIKPGTREPPAPRSYTRRKHDPSSRKANGPA